MTVIFVTSDLGCEVGLTALARFLIPSDVCWCINAKIDALKNSSILCDMVSGFCKDPAVLALCGDFWTLSAIECIRDKFPEMVIYQYKFDTTVKCLTHDTEEPGTDMTPTQFVTWVAEKTLGASPMMTAAVAQHKRTLDLLDARCLNRDTATTQPFITGLCNIPGDIPINLEKRILDILVGVISIDEVMKIGKLIVSSQVGVAQERALKNARRGGLDDGTTFVITEGGEFVNLTHEALHQAYPGAKITVVVSLKFTGNGVEEDHIAHSLRAWDPAIDVKKIATKYGGGGSPQAAGFRSPIENVINY